MLQMLANSFTPIFKLNKNATAFSPSKERSFLNPSAECFFSECELNPPIYENPNQTQHSDKFKGILDTTPVVCSTRYNTRYISLK